ncbi:MAG: PorV/PorQ family protein [Elusimicrobiota bacterium]
MAPRVLLIALLTCVPPAALRAAPGTTAANFLKIGVAPRPVALGETFVGLADDVNALAYNPAGLAFLDRQEASFMHNRFFDGISQQWGAYAFPSARWGTFGVGFNVLQVDPFESYDEFDRPTGEVSASDMATLVGWAMEVGESRALALGASGKYIRQRLSGYRAGAGAIDLGALWRSGAGKGGLDGEWRLGAGLRNIGTNVKFIDESFPLPLSGHLGASYGAPLPHPFSEMRWIVAADAGFPNDRDPYFSGGLEFIPIKDMAIRVGYRNNQDSGAGVSAGLGFRALHRGFVGKWWPDFEIDYAFVDFGRLEQTHRFGMTFRFGPDKHGDYGPPGRKGTSPRAYDW